MTREESLGRLQGAKPFVGMVLLSGRLLFMRPLQSRSTFLPGQWMKAVMYLRLLAAGCRMLKELNLNFRDLLHQRLHDQETPVTSDASTIYFDG